MTATASFQLTAAGSWEVHPSRTGFLGTERFRRRPSRHIVLDDTGWRLYETASRRRLKRAGLSRGTWRVVDVDGRPLLVLAVDAYRPSAAAEAMLESNYGYTGGAGVVIGTRAGRDAESRKMRNREALMYFLPVRVGRDEIIMALPCDGRYTPRQRWVRVPT